MMSFLTYRSNSTVPVEAIPKNTNRAQIKLISFGTLPNFNPISKELEINVVLFQISLFGL